MVHDINGSTLVILHFIPATRHIIKQEYDSPIIGCKVVFVIKEVARGKRTKCACGDDSTARFHQEDGRTLSETLLFWI